MLTAWRAGTRCRPLSSIDLAPIEAWRLRGMLGCAAALLRHVPPELVTADGSGLDDWRQHVARLEAEIAKR